MSETTDTITKQFVEGFGVVQIGEDDFIAEPIRSMTPAEIKEREDLNKQNTTEALRKRVLLYRLADKTFEIPRSRRPIRDNPQD